MDEGQGCRNVMLKILEGWSPGRFVSANNDVLVDDVVVDEDGLFSARSALSFQLDGVDQSEAANSECCNVLEHLSYLTVFRDCFFFLFY